jgi:hypothetical protein
MNTHTDRTLSEEERSFNALLMNPDWIHYIGMLLPLRPGVAESIVRLEYKHFPPGTDVHRWLHINMVAWEDVCWAVTSIPLTSRHLMDDLLMQYFLRAVPGVPTRVRETTIDGMPLVGTNMYTMESLPNSPVWSPTVEEHAAYLSHENAIREVLP